MGLDFEETGVEEFRRSNVVVIRIETTVTGVCFACPRIPVNLASHGVWLPDMWI